MSWQATAWALRQTCGLPGLKLTLLALAAYADRSGMAWPTQKVLAEVTEQSHDSVQRHVDELERLGLISVDRSRRRGGQHQVFRYQLKTGPHLAYSNQAAQSVVLNTHAAYRPVRTVRPHHYANDPPTTTQMTPKSTAFAEQNQQLKPAETSLEETSRIDGYCGKPQETSILSVDKETSAAAAAQPLETSKEVAERPSRDELQAKYPDLLLPKLKRMPLHDLPQRPERDHDQQSQTTPEPEPQSANDVANVVPSASLLRIELAKRLRRSVSDEEVEAYIAQQAKA
jgi:hypothetical protein